MFFSTDDLLTSDLQQRSVLDVQVSIDFQDWKKTQQLYHSPSHSLWLSSRFHTSLQLYPLFICFHVRLIDFFLPCSYLFVFLFLVLGPVIHAYCDDARSSGYIFNYKYVAETFKHRCTCNLQIQICYSFIWCLCFCVNETPLSLHF